MTNLSRPRKLNKSLLDTAVRLHERDKTMLKDLAKVQFLSDDIIDKHHSDGVSTPAKKRMNRLVNAGILQRMTLQTENGTRHVYQFADHKVAQIWGAKISKIGANRSLNHELIVSKLYYDLGKPSDFRKENKFNKKDKNFITKNIGSEEGVIPDALCTNSQGHLIFIEADSGNYNSTQIRTKQNAWQGYQQVWGQPVKSHTRIQSRNKIRVHHY